jgi:hypothetical protein
MELTPEKLAFIEGRGANADLAVTEPPISVPPQAAAAQEHSVVPRQRQKKQPALAEPNHASLLGTLLVPLTTRLQTPTADALRRAYLERKLRGESPHTQQEIVEEALQIWLRKEGFL